MKKILFIAILSCFLLFNSNSPAFATYCLIYESMHQLLIEKNYEITKVFLDDNETKYELYMKMKTGEWMFTFIRFINSPSAGVNVKFSCMIAKGPFSSPVPTKSF